MFYKIKDGKTYLNVRVTTRASKNEVTGIKNNELAVSVTGIPENNKANIAIIKVLSDKFDIAKSKMQIILGAKNRSKVVCVDQEISRSTLDKIS